MGGSDSAMIVARLAQRRVALLLLPLRVFIGVAWLRRGLAMVLQPEWHDGTALTGFLQNQAADAPLALYTDVMLRAADRFAAPMGMAFALGEIAIGIGLITGTLTNLALLMAIVLNVNLVLAGAGAPSQYFIVIQLVLLAGGAGSDFSMDRGLSRYLRSSLLTSRSGVVDGVDAPRPGLAILAVTTIGLALGMVAGGVVSFASLLPDDGVDESGYTIVLLLAVTAMLAIALFVARRADDDDGRMLTAADFPRPARPPAPPPARPTAPGGRAVPVGARFDAPADVRQDTMAMPPAGSGPDRGRAARSHRPVPEPEPVQPWPDPSPLMSPVGAAPARQDQPTTQFSRPSRRPAPDRRADDPYAELRDLPPN